MLEGLAGNKLKTLATACLDVIRLVWQDLEDQGLPADKFLAEFFRANHKYGSRDRHAITSSVFAFFRWKGCLEKLFEINRENIPGPALSAALAADDPSCPVFPFWCDVAPDVLAAMKDPFERIRTVTNTDLEMDVYDLVPEWMPDEVPEASRQAWLDGLTSHSPLWLRAQNITATELIRRLAAQDIQAERGSEVLVDAVRVKTPHAHPDQVKNLVGNFEVQDYSSQCIVWPADPQPKEKWWDCCCGAGGKTLQLAAVGGKKAQIYASDIRQDVLAQLKKRMLAAKFRNIIITTPLGGALGEYDGVLVDAPCSASGRWRRNPEMRWIFKQEDLPKLTKTQFAILDKAANAVRPGGKLVYGTCSVFDAENMGVVKRFLQARPDFKLKPFKNPHDGSRTDGTLTTLPCHADCDSSFTALFVRNGGK